MNGQPTCRRLRIFAFDPSLASRLESVTFNQVTVEIPWEQTLGPGPIGEYIEVLDVDPASAAVYPPIELNAPNLLAQDGVAPSESDPKFHQQMVYAVAMTTIRHFERALGRVCFWADHRVKDAAGNYSTQFVRRLRIYPHALREQNAYYSPAKKALLFGYFPVTRRDKYNTPGTLVFTCLSHDIVAHETTHALLDGVHPRFNEPTNPDVHSFHEAFADIVALFQHFTYPAVLQSQIRRTQGDFDSESLLAQLAQQFGRSTGRGSALRDALGHTDEKTDEWVPRKPNPDALDTSRGPHERGSVLVAAVFRTFVLIYRSRTADLFRLATQGTGKLPEGDIHPDLTQRLSVEAARCADQVLQMCIRAIDYCPPVDITFGDFLRGIITADIDFAPADAGGFRTAFIESFREWGIYPRGVLSMGEDALVWPSGHQLLDDLAASNTPIPDEKAVKAGLKKFVEETVRSWNLDSDRFEVWKSLTTAKQDLHTWIMDGDSVGRDFTRIFGLTIDHEAPPTVSRKDGRPAVEIHSVRPVQRKTIRGSLKTDLVIEITQRRSGYLDPDRQREADKEQSPSLNLPKEDFVYRAGSTLMVDVATGEIRWVIHTAGGITDNEALERVRRFISGEDGTSGNAYDSSLPLSVASDGHPVRNEPFALMHRQED